MKNSIIDYFEETVKKYPDKPAFCDNNREITFGELREEAVKIAGGLLEAGIKRSPVVVFLDKRVGVLSCFMGIAYSGNFYTPIDVAMPPARIRKILETLEPAAIITEPQYRDRVADESENIPCYSYSELAAGEIDEGIAAAARERIIDSDLLYVLFTSGSTGKPKGVAISHKAVMDFATAVIERFQITERERFGNQGPFYFDLSVLDIYCTLFSGATMFIIPPEHFKFPVKLLQYVREKQINAVFWVPSALVVVANLRALKAVEVSCLKKIMFCGEVMPNKQLNIWRKYVPDAWFVNMYGPTETTCASTYYIVDRTFEDMDSLPIGRPFPNTRILLLNEQDKVPPQGEIGEICIAGTSLSCGYYGDEEKTREVFVRNPLQSKYHEVIYRTGDLARYNEYGELIYLSRRDFQIKHMGHRIELGEIENAVMSLPDVKECCCLYDETKSKITVFMTGGHADEETAAAGLRQLLPDYMQPNTYYFLDEMPHNLNGKIDRSKLKGMLQTEKGAKKL